MEPPAAKLELADAAPGKDVSATLSAWSRGVNPEQDLVRAEVWINDYRLLVTAADVDGLAEDGADVHAPADDPLRQAARADAKMW